jgi:hypothetical protein
MSPAKKRVLVVVPGLLLIGFLLQARSSIATPEYARRTRKDCLYCHPKGSWTLTDAGKYYRDHKSLEGYKPN